MRLFSVILFAVLAAVFILIYAVTDTRPAAAQAGQIPDWPPVQFVGTVAPTQVDLNFAAGTFSGCSSLTSCLSVTRTTTETCEPPGGTLSYATAGNACITAAGLHVFAAATNLKSHSQDVSGGWGVLNGALSTGSANTAPDGTASELIFTDNTTNGNHYFTAGGPTGGFVAGTTYTNSIFLKAGTCNTANLECSNVLVSIGKQGSDNPWTSATPSAVQVDLTTCNVYYPLPASSPSFRYRTTAFANGWCKISVTFKVDRTANVDGFIVFMQRQQIWNAAPDTYVGALSTVKFWGAQFTVSQNPLPYCPTTTTTATCNKDQITDGGSDTTLKTTLEGAALRAVYHIAANYQAPVTAAAYLGVGTTLYGLGLNTSWQGQTSWPVTATLNSGGQSLSQAFLTAPLANAIGLSADASGRSLVLNGQAAASDLNGLSASTLEYIGELSDGSATCNCIISRIQAWNTRDDAAMRTAAQQNVQSLIGSYTGPVALHTRIPGGLKTDHQIMQRSHHVATESLTTGWKIRFPNYYVPIGTPNAETGPGAAATITASVEYPSGSCTQVLFSGSASGTIADNGTLLSDAISATIPAGAEFWIRDYNVNPNGVVVSPLGNDSSNGEVGHGGASGIADQTVSCDAITTNNSGNYLPDAIVGPTQLHSYCLIGDSRTEGVSDVYGSYREDLGENERWVSPWYSSINMGLSGDQATNFIASNTDRKTLLNYCTGMIVESGVNDVFNSGRSAATVEASLTTLYGLKTNLAGGSGPVWQSTIMVETSAAATSWTTIGGQSCTGSAGNCTAIDTVNTWIRANTAGITGFFENHNVFSNASTGGVWNVTGLSFGWTNGGVHSTPNGYHHNAYNKGFQTLQ